MISNILGGIGLFLLGMVLMTDGLKALAGDALRRVLTRFTGGPLSALASGAVLTAMVQSSSATTLATIGFVSAGLLTFPQAVGVIFGANLGTTSTGWLVSTLGLKFSISVVSMPMVGVGALLNLVARGRLRAIGVAFAGFGLIFVGIDALQGGMQVLSTKIDPGMFPRDDVFGRLLLVGVGVVMTVVMQSSSAAVTTTLAALHAGTIDFEQAAALVIGQNVGTTVTAGIAAFGASVPAKRTALAHGLFNGLTGTVAFLALPLFVGFTQRVAAAGWEEDAAVTLAAFHTVFNLTGVLLLLPVIGRFAALVERMVPEKKPRLTRHLDPSVSTVNAVAVEAARRTALEVAREIFAMLEARLRGEDTDGVEVRLEAAREAIAETRRFLSTVHADIENPSLQRRRLGVVHAMDHLGQLARALEEPVKLAILEGQVAALRDRLAAALAEAAPWMAEGAEQPPVAPVAEVAQLLREESPRARRQTLRETAAGTCNANDANQRIEAVRWLYRAGHHGWRIVHHLGADGGGEEESIGLTAPD